ncbi:hypothetical protein [Allorhizocola rhizosphaerae]|uniref:hypothetical protein n=1 Tax=Allorhizocola rhizosphaerae TaxID=1872709 RepID=UPI000E3C0666|nr:hypothetical protein [Allorhizocola rhizosphaerae]
MKEFDRLIGTWKLTGGAQGTVRYEWMEGGHFLLQHVDVTQDGHAAKGLEVIGHERPLFGEPSEEVKSRFYSTDGSTLDYIYEIDGNTLTIWGGEKGSPAYCTTVLSEDGNSLHAKWVWPGGGYETDGVRMTS